jgi:hypothetical protein
LTYLIIGEQDVFADKNVNEIIEGYKKIKSGATAFNGLISILTDLYGGFEERTYKDWGRYLVFGTGDSAFSLNGDELIALLKSVRDAIRPIVENLTAGQTLMDKVKKDYAAYHMIFKED